MASPQKMLLVHQFITKWPTKSLWVPRVSPPMPPDVLQQPPLLCQVGAPHVAWRTDRPGRMESPSRSKRRWHTQRHPQIVRTRRGIKGEAAISERPTSVSEIDCAFFPGQKNNVERLGFVHTQGISQSLAIKWWGIWFSQPWNGLGVSQTSQTNPNVLS